MAGQQTNWDQSLEHVALSDIGMRRAINQDSYAAIPAEDIESWREHGHLFVVADGMGAHVAGEMASQMAVQCIPHVYLKHRGEPPSEAIKTAVLEANAQINRRGNETIEFYHMGTTCSTLLLLPQGALAAHVGDSRIYRLRGKYLEQLTFDHSLVWEMRAAGKMPKDAQKAAAIPKNVITRSLGPYPAVKVDLEGPFPTVVGDTFLMCSDGLTGEVNDEELGPILSCLEPAEAAPFLVHLANLRGGPDNITLIIIKVTGAQQTTRAAAAEPLSHARRAAETPKAVHPALWVVIAACLLAGVGMVIAQHTLAAVLLTAAAGVAALLAVVQKFSDGGRQRDDTPSGQRFGSGPHSKTSGQAARPIVKTLAETAQQLREAAEDENWSIDRSRVDRHISQAASAAGDRRYADAVRESSRAIRIMMDESRSRQKKGADRPDSASP